MDLSFSSSSSTLVVILVLMDVPLNDLKPVLLFGIFNPCSADICSNVCQTQTIQSISILILMDVFHLYLTSIFFLKCFSLFFLNFTFVHWVCIPFIERALSCLFSILILMDVSLKYSRIRNPLY